MFGVCLLCKISTCVWYYNSDQLILCLGSACFVKYLLVCDIIYIDIYVYIHLCNECLPWALTVLVQLCLMVWNFIRQMTYNFRSRWHSLHMRWCFKLVFSLPPTGYHSSSNNSSYHAIHHSWSSHGLSVVSSLTLIQVSFQVCIRIASDLSAFVRLHSSIH